MEEYAERNVPQDKPLEAFCLLCFFYYDFSRPERKERRLIMILKVPLCIPYFLAALQFDGFPGFFFFFWTGGGEQQYFWCCALWLRRRRRRRTVLWVVASQCFISERNIQNIIHRECMQPDFITTPKAELTHVLIVIMRQDLAIYHFTAAQRKNDLDAEENCRFSASSHVGVLRLKSFRFLTLGQTIYERFPQNNY